MRVRAAASSQSICLSRRCGPDAGSRRPWGGIGVPVGRVRLHFSQRDGEGGHVHRRQRARCRDALVAVRRARAVEGADEGELHPRQHTVRRRPQGALAAAELRQLGQDAPAVGAVRLALDPAADRLPVLARRELHREQDVGLAQHVLVQHGRALGDQPRHEAAHTAASHDLLDLPQQRLPVRLGPLRRPKVGLVQHQVQRLRVGLVQGFRERCHE